MQIVIDIPEQLKKKIDNDFISSENFGNLIWYYALLIESIKDCVVLPNGHGRLIDADKIQFENGDFDTYSDYSRAFDAIDNADTIIPADKEVIE